MPRHIAGRVSLAVLISAMSLAATPAVPQFTPFAHDASTILEGSWLSCREDDGRYTERVYDHIVNGVGRFELHLGPRNEFALFSDVQDEHRDHASAVNLLTPFRVVVDAGRAKQRWDIPSLGLAFTATLAGGSRTDCESWFVLLEPLKKPSH